QYRSFPFDRYRMKPGSAKLQAQLCDGCEIGAIGCWCSFAVSRAVCWLELNDRRRGVALGAIGGRIEAGCASAVGKFLSLLRREACNELLPLQGSELHHLFVGEAACVEGFPLCWRDLGDGSAGHDAQIRLPIMARLR